MALLAWLVADELNTSRLQARYLSRLGQELRFAPEPGPSPEDTIRFPHSGPYDERMGYSQIPAFTQSLTARGYAVTQQARISPRMAELADNGLPLAYAEKNQAGLELRDCNAQSLYAERFPERGYADFRSVPSLLVNTLLFIEDRDLLDDSQPQHNPAINWGRFSKALTDQVVHAVDKSHEAPGASTLVTQIEKYRHSPEGRTASPREKLRQMASASIKTYLGGENTLAFRQQTVVDYLNTVPLAAKPGYGEINGMGDGLWAWYGRDFSEANQLLQDKASETGAALHSRAEAFKQALSLMIAQRRPSYYLREGRAALQQLADSHLRVLATAGVISPALRDAALPIQLKLQQDTGAAPPVSFVTRKAVTALRAHLSSLLQVKHLYDLDRFDMAANATLNGEVQHEVSTVLRQLSEPASAKAAGLYGHNMLSPGDDPSKLVFSFTLFEQRDGANLLRVQTDNFDQPFDINEGARLNLGSTAKLRTLITYLEIITELHQRYAAMDPQELAAAKGDDVDVLSRWARAYIAQAQDKSLRPMLEAAMERSYSGNPGESFVTGGGVQSFENFEPEENYKVMTVRESFQHSVNLVFVRLMRDVVQYYQFQRSGASSAALPAADAPARQEILARFADKEGRQFMARFYRKYQGLAPDAAQDLLLQTMRPVPARLATVFRSLQPNADLAQFSAFMRQRLPGMALSDAQLQDLYAKYAVDKFSLADRGYIAGVHPLELWVLSYMHQQPAATLAQTLQASSGVRQEVYSWLFRSNRKVAQDKRIRQMLELEAFQEIAQDWRRLGYPFESLTPSLATALGASGDRPAALAELMGIIVNKGMRLPLRKLHSLDFASGTPFATRFESHPAAGERLLPEELTEVVRRSLLDVVNGGTASRLRGGFKLSNGSSIDIGGKTGTGDHRFETYGPGGQLVSSRAVNRSATFVFLLGDRFFGTMTAYVHEPYAANYRFTSALSAQLLKSLAPTLLASMDGGASTSQLACRP
jgi:membrane peptidoglycan carboxypeptidase